MTYKKLILDLDTIEEFFQNQHPGFSLDLSEINAQGGLDPYTQKSAGGFNIGKNFSVFVNENREISLMINGETYKLGKINVDGYMFKINISEVISMIADRIRSGEIK